MAQPYGSFYAFSPDVPGSNLKDFSYTSGGAVAKWSKAQLLSENECKPKSSQVRPPCGPHKNKYLSLAPRIALLGCRWTSFELKITRMSKLFEDLLFEIRPCRQNVSCLYKKV